MTKSDRIIFAAFFKLVLLGIRFILSGSGDGYEKWLIKLNEYLDCIEYWQCGKVFE